MRVKEREIVRKRIVERKRVQLRPRDIQKMGERKRESKGREKKRKKDR